MTRHVPQLTQGLLQVTQGVLSFIFIAINTFIWGTLIIIVSPFKFIFRWDKLKRIINSILVKFGENWVATNNLGLKWTQSTRWHVTGLNELNRHSSYFIISNHLSWVDIIVLQNVFHRKVPFLRFFIKRQLMLIPILGQAWWALDFPAVRRYTRQFLDRHPEKKGEDIKTIRKMCERYKKSPISVLNFLEGTRLTLQKHGIQKSPYRHLLKPKVGGFSLVLEVMGEQFQSLLDVTIVYPKGQPSFWHLLSGQIQEVIIHVQELGVPLHLGRAQLEAWTNDLWALKDQQIAKILERSVLHPNSIV